MATLPHSYWFNHLTEIDGIKWRPIDWDAAKIVKGLKQEQFKGYVRWKVGGAWHDYYAHNIENFVNVIMPGMGRKLSEEVSGNVLIVPIPNSKMAVGAKGDFRIIELQTNSPKVLVIGLPLFQQFGGIKCVNRLTNKKAGVAQRCINRT